MMTEAQMQTLVMIQVPATQWYWRDLDKGYLVLGELTLPETGPADGILTPDPDLAYLDVRTGRVHRYRPAVGEEPGHFEFDADAIIDLVGYPAIAEAIDGKGTVRIAFDLPDDRGLRAMTERSLEAATHRSSDDLAREMRAEGSLAIGARALKDLIIALVRIGHGRLGGIQVHDLIPGLRLAA